MSEPELLVKTPDIDTLSDTSPLDTSTLPEPSSDMTSSLSSDLSSSIQSTPDSNLSATDTSSLSNSQNNFAINNQVNLERRDNIPTALNQMNSQLPLGNSLPDNSNPSVNSVPLANSNPLANSGNLLASTSNLSDTSSSINSDISLASSDNSLVDSGNSLADTSSSINTGSVSTNQFNQGMTSTGEIGSNAIPTSTTSDMTANPSFGRRRKTLKKRIRGGSDEKDDKPDSTDTSESTDSSPISPVQSYSESQISQAKTSEELSNLARAEQLREENVLDEKRDEEEKLSENIEEMKEKDTELETEIQELTSQDESLRDKVEQEQSQATELEEQIVEDKEDIDKLRKDFEIEKENIEQERTETEKMRLEKIADNERIERMKMIVKTTGLDLKKIHKNKDKLTTFFANKKKKDLEYPSDLQKVNDADVQRLLEDIWCKEVVEGYTFLELLEAVLKNIDDVDIKMLNRYLELVKINIELDILLINGKLLDDIFGYNEEITGDITDIGLSTLVEREFVVDQENPEMTSRKLEFLATLLLSPDILDIEYMQHFESRSVRNNYAKVVMRHLLDGIDNIDSTHNVERFMSFWETCDHETQMSLQDIAHKKLLVLGKADMLKMKKVDKVGKFSNKTNPICKEMLHILRQELEHNQEVVIDKTRLAELSNCDN